MKHRKLFGIALLFPYLLWVICIFILDLFPQQDMSDIWSFVRLAITYYMLGAIFWFIPYTILAYGMWIWSKNKPVASLRKLGLLSPILFSILMIIEFSILWSFESDWKELLGALASLFAICAFTGYLIVGIALTVYKILQSKNLVAEEVQTAN